ncbi:hypothetical protein [Actinokineospora sp. HUAS TT18]|uniref:hypothetical protein n=1 Tax=Actinokineospora sp. HUAS TT18 TaxID=3447451 RepID=UPI003F52366F
MTPVDRMTRALGDYRDFVAHALKSARIPKKVDSRLRAGVPLATALEGRRARPLDIQLRAGVPLADDVQVAILLSTAAHISPELLRRVRLRVLPHLDVGAESDFWFSEWIGWRRPDAVTLRPDVRPLLWPHLARLLATADRRDRIGELRGLLVAAHSRVAPALRVEEFITWRTMRNGETGARVATRSLYSALKAMDDPDRARALADWVVRARRMLPESALNRIEAWHLTLRAAELRRRDIVAAPRRDALVVRENGGVAIPAATIELLEPVARYFPPRRLPVRRVNGDLVVGGPHHPDAFYIKVPETDPMLVRVHGGPWFAVDGGKAVVHRVSADADIKLITLDGQFYELPAVRPDSIKTSQVLVSIVVPGSETTTKYWLQPVRYRPRSDAPVRQPVELLTLATAVIDTEPDDLRDWRESDNHCSLQLLFGGEESRRLREADRFAEASFHAGWAVYRARPDPDEATWLTDGLPPAGPSGLLVVVDHADHWRPRHLSTFVLSLANADGPVRVLAIASRASQWWHECERFLAESRIAVRQRATAPADRVRGSRTAMLEACVTAVADAAEPLSVPRPRRVSAEGIPVKDIPPVAVASILSGQAVTRPEEAVGLILALEQRYRVDSLPEQQREPVARLAFLAAIARPCTQRAAQALALDNGVITDRSDWPDLIGAYERFYRDEPNSVATPGPATVCDRMIVDVLADRTRELGVSGDWAREVLARLPGLVADTTAANDDERARLLAVGNIVTVIARLAMAEAGKPHKPMRDRVLDLVKNHPALCVAAGGRALEAIIDLLPSQLLATVELRAVSDLLADDTDRDPALDNAAMRIEQVLARPVLDGRDVPPAEAAPLLLRVAKARYRAGYLWTARDAATDAVDRYRVIVSAPSPRDRDSDVAAYAEALAVASRVEGELGNTERALELAEHAERETRRPAAHLSADDIGAATANLAIQQLRLAEKTNAHHAIAALRRLTDTAPQRFRGDLLDGLVVYSSWLANTGRHADALAHALEAVELARSLHKSSPWAHAHKLADAHRCHAARLAERGQYEEALAEAGEAERLVRPLVEVSPVRFQAQLAEIMLLSAELLAHLGQADAKPLARTAVALFEASSVNAASATATQRERARTLGARIGEET